MVKRKKQTRKKKTIRAYRRAVKKSGRIIRRSTKKKNGTSGTGPRLSGDDNEA